MTNTVNNAQLPFAVSVLLDPDLDLNPPELVVIVAALSALPVGNYVVWDSEDHGIPNTMYTWGGPVVASWDGSAANSLGYGDLQWVTTRSGPALLITVAGSSGSSASCIAAFPADLVGYLED